MLQLSFISILLLFWSTNAQPNCTTPVIKLLQNTQDVTVGNQSFTPELTLRVEAVEGCPAQRFRFRNAEVTLVRRGRPVLPSKLISQPQLNLSTWQSAYQPGDAITVFIAYQNLAVVASDGTLQRYAKPAKPSSGHIDLRTDDAKGISILWTPGKQ